MTGRPDDTRLHDWLDGTVGQTPDPVTGTRQVMSQVGETSQVGRWLPFPVRQRRPGSTRTSAIDDTIEYQVSPIPATNGHTPIVIGRTSSMFSAVQAISVGALAVALGGVMLIVQPSGRQGGGAPGAEAEAIASTWVTGNITHAPGCTGPDSTQDGDVRHDWNSVCEPQTWTSSDERFTGKVSARFNEDVHQTDQGTISVNTAAYYLRNGDGGWACSTSSLLKGSGYYPETVTGDTVRCVGEGGYEGLSALLVVQDEPLEPFVGLIFSGDFPPVPDAPAAE